MQLLYAMATKQEFPPAAAGCHEIEPYVNKIEKAGYRGRTPCWEDLNGKWSIDGNRYGQDIVAMWRSMIDWKGAGEVYMEKPSEEMKWLRERRLLPNPAPHPDRNITWSELSGLLQRWENSISPDTMGETGTLSKKKDG
jgi:hypothetical protein